jgi:hypothetical protein
MPDIKKQPAKTPQREAWLKRKGRELLDKLAPQTADAEKQKAQKGSNIKKIEDRARAIEEDKGYNGTRKY